MNRRAFLFGGAAAAVAAPVVAQAAPQLVNMDLPADWLARAVPAGVREGDVLVSMLKFESGATWAFTDASPEAILGHVRVALAGLGRGPSPSTMVLEPAVARGLGYRDRIPVDNARRAR